MQYASDYHLEARRRWPSLVPSAPYLALCGDIGSPRRETYMEFLRETCPRFERVFLLMGNHEAYGSSVGETEEMIRRLAGSLPNVTFLQNEAAHVTTAQGTVVRILGTTMWGNCPDAAGELRDFRRIYDAGSWGRSGRFSPAAMRALHQESREFLARELQTSWRPTIVLSHHAPLPEMNGPFVGHPAADAYASDVRDLMTDAVRGWICGHVHINGRFSHRGIPVVTNQLGYPGEKVKGFRVDAVLEV